MGSASTPSVIIADNNEFYRTVLGDFYRDLDFNVRVASDGMEALEMLGERTPDLLVLDLIMPAIDGSQLCAWVKTRESYRQVPVIIFSGILSDEIGDVSAIGADAYIAKMPLDRIADALKEATRALLCGKRIAKPLMYGFEKMFRREVVLELVQERRARMEILDSLTEGIVEVSGERRLLRTNRAFQEMAGMTASELLSRPLEEVFPEAGMALTALFERLHSNGSVAVVTFSHAGRDLQAKLHLVSGDRLSRKRTGDLVRSAGEQSPKVRIDSMVEAVGYTMLVEDVTQTVRAERDRERLHERLAQSEKMSALNVFISGAAHELNNPLTSILGYAQLLMKREGAPNHALERIAQGAQRCKTIVEQLSVISRNLNPERGLEDLNALLREAVAAHRDRIEKEGIRLDMKIGPGPVEARVDASQMTQAFHHLLDNAIKALAGAKDRRSIEIATGSEADRAMIEISDTGPGIPEALMSRVFDPFFTTGQEGQGRGLGLSVVYGVVTAHQGRVEAKNRPEGGAVIRVELPVVGSIATARETQKVSASRHGPRRILVVDDETVVAELLVDVFASYEHQIDAAYGGMDALRLMRERDYDLVILDLRMPDMSGQQVYAELAKERPELLSKLLFITGDSVMPEIKEFIEQAGSPCLPKPFSVEDVVSKANTILYPAS